MLNIIKLPKIVKTVTFNSMIVPRLTMGRCFPAEATHNAFWNPVFLLRGDQFNNSLNDVLVEWIAGATHGRSGDPPGL